MDHLLQGSIRSILLAAVAAVGLWRVRSASVRHAVWALVTASMLVQIALGPVLPEIPLRVLAAPPPAVIIITNMTNPDVPAERPPSASWSWEELAGAVYLCGLVLCSARFVIALRFAQRLARASEPAVDGAYGSARIAAPLTIGNRILLPMSWLDWDSGKRQAVLAHEQAHVHRRDWAVAAMARVNRCVFWFHPLAWWLERQLARLAEQACDDAALAVVEDRELYARTLLDVARAIQISGRVLSAPMAREANVETRIDRILDETRRIPRGLGRRGWMALAVCAAPVVYVASAVQLTPAQTAVMSVPSPLVPQAPAVPAPPQTPAGVMIAQAAVPAPTQPPPAPQSQVDQLQLQRERIILEDEIRMVQANMQKAQIVTQLQAAQSVPPDQAAFDTVTFIGEELERLKAQLEAMPQPAAVGPIGVSVTPVLLQSITISLDPAVQYYVIGEIQNEAGEAAASFRDKVENHRQAVFQVTLKAGRYSLKILLRDLKDASMSTRETNFEVK